jgi:hypothetical protein
MATERRTTDDDGLGRAEEELAWVANAMSSTEITLVRSERRRDAPELDARALLELASQAAAASLAQDADAGAAWPRIICASAEALYEYELRESVSMTERGPAGASRLDKLWVYLVTVWRVLIMRHHAHAAALIVGEPRSRDGKGDSDDVTSGELPQLIGLRVISVDAGGEVIEACAEVELALGHLVERGAWFEREPDVAHREGLLAVIA